MRNILYSSTAAMNGLRRAFSAPGRQPRSSRNLSATAITRGRVLTGLGALSAKGSQHDRVGTAPQDHRLHLSLADRAYANGLRRRRLNSAGCSL